MPPTPTPPTTKYYEADNCNRAIRGASLAFNFHPYELNGSWLGVYSTDKPAEIADLDKLVAAKKIATLTEEQYNRCLKKKAQSKGGYSGDLASTTPTPGEAAPSAEHTVVETLLDAAPDEADPLKTVDDAITPVPVQNKTEAGK